MSKTPSVIAEVLAALETYNEFAEEVGFAVDREAGTVTAEVYGEEGIEKRFAILISVSTLEATE